MAPYVQELLKLITKKGATLVIMMDQSKISSDRQCLMILIAFQNRAMPVLWVVVDSEGSLGFDIQEPLLNKVKEMIPPGVKVFFVGDRFGDVCSFKELCQRKTKTIDAIKKHVYHYRMRVVIE
ncbi:MAG: hypothetical protein LBJ89_03150, partial [Holosporales bacterium]|nr:hypothetical protein [Holosporales bacterium]